MPINFNDLDKITFDGTVYNELTKASDNTSAITQDNSNVTYDNFLLHSSKEWLSTLENNSTELIKSNKDTADKIKADNKIIEAVKKAAPDGQPFKEVEQKLLEGAKDLTSNVAAAVDINKYNGALNFITSTAINQITGAYNLTADMNVDIRGPSITTTSNVDVTNTNANFNFSNTVFSKTDRDITVTNQQLTSASDKHAVVTNTTSITSDKNKTSAVSSIESITKENKQYSEASTILTTSSVTIGSKGSTNINSQGGLVISDGQSLKSGASQASTSDGLGAALGTSDGETISGSFEGSGGGSIKILSTGETSIQATHGVYTQGNTVSTNANNIGLASIDFASNSTTTTISSKVQSVLMSEAITYTGSRDMGISITPFGILAGIGVAPLVPVLAELLPPIIIDVPELPEFPFGSLADFLAKCLPFTSAVDLSKADTNTTSIVEDEAPLINLEDTVVVQDKSLEESPLINLEDTVVQQSKGNIDEPLNIALEDPLVAGDKKAPSAVKGIKTEQKEADITTIRSTSTTSTKEKPHNPGAVITSAAKLGIVHTVYPNRPEDSLNKKTSTTISTSDVASITPQLSYSTSLKSLTSLQQAEVVNSFNVTNRNNISTNYSEFLKSVAIVDVYGSQPSSDYSKTINDFLSNNLLVKEITTFLNTKRPIGVGGQQPVNIQDDISNRISDLSSGGTEFVKTPPVLGQGLIDLLTFQSTQLNQSPTIFSSTSENWYNPEEITNFQESDIKFGDELINNSNLSSISDLLNNQYVNFIKGVIPDSKIQSALSLTQDIAAGNITTPQQYANRLASLVGGEVGGYLAYAEQALNIYDQVQAGNYTSLLGIPGISNVLGSKGTAVASQILGLISKKNITDKDIYSVVGNIFTALTGIGIPLLDELAKLLGCIDSLKQEQPLLQSINNSDLQDIIDYLPRIIQTTIDNNIDKTVLNITPTNCGQISELSAEEATINVTEVGPSYIRFKLDNKNLIQYNNKPLPTIGTPVNVYTEFYSDRITNLVLIPYKEGSQFTSNVIEYKITNKVGDTYTATLNNNSTVLTLENNISGSLYAYTSNDIGNRLSPHILDSYVLL